MKILPRICSLGLLLALTAFGAGQTNAQTVNTDRYITLTVKSGVDIKLNLQTDDENTPIRIVSGTKTYNVTVGTDWTYNKYLSDGTIMTVYGDVIRLACQENNDITGLDPSHNTILQTLNCNKNKITSLDVSKNIYLEYLLCNDNQLTSLDVSNNKTLVTLRCDNNHLSHLDLTANYILTEINASGNVRPVVFPCDVSTLPGFDVNKVSNIVGGTLKDGVFTANAGSDTIAYTYEMKSDVKETFKLTGPTMSRYITLKVEKNTGINLKLKAETANTPIKIVSGSKIYDVTVGDDWTESQIYWSDGTTMTVYGDLVGFNCKGIAENVTALDPSHNTKLLTLNCTNNKITSLDVSKNTALQYLACGGNWLSHLDLTANTALQDLYCYTNWLNTLDLSKNTELKILNCSKNNLSHLDLTANTKLGSDIYANENAHRVIFPCAVSSLPGFDTSKVSEIAGGKLTDGVFTANEGSTEISYKYEMQPGKKETFKLQGPTVNKDRYITLTVKKGVDIKLTFKAEAARTNILIESGSSYPALVVDTSWRTVNTYRSYGTTMTVYGNLLGFDCSDNGANVTALDVSHNTGLKILRCQNDRLTTLDVSKNTALEGLNCSQNQLTTLDLSQNTALAELKCQKNHLSHLDLTANKKLTAIKASGNVHPVVFPCAVSSLPGFDVDKMSEITGGTQNGGVFTTNSGSTEISYKYQMRLGKTETFWLTGPTVNLDRYITLTVQDTAEIDLRLKADAANTGVKIVSGTKTYDVTVREYWTDGRYLSDDTTMTVYGDISIFSCSDNKERVTGLDPSKNAVLKELYCHSNLLTSLDLSKNINLEGLDCSYNKLTSLNLNKNTELYSFNCNSNKLTTLDVSANTKLKEFDCGHNRLTSLDVSHNTKLQKLHCQDNCLSHLDLTANTLLTADKLQIWYNVHEIPNNLFPIADLPAGFKVENCSAIDGGEFTDDNKVNITAESGIMSYKYLMASGLNDTFRISIPKVTISFNPNGGTGTMDPVKVDKGSQYTLPPCTFTAPADMEFDKWDEGAVGEIITVNYDLTLRAKWKWIHYTVKFDANGGSGEMPSVTVMKGVRVEIPDCSFTPPEGKKFDQWSLDIDNQKYNPGDYIDVTNNMIFKALWVQSTAVDVDHSTQLTVYPNPARNWLNIKGVDMKSVSLYDMLGRLVSVRPADSATTTVLNVNTYNPGIYMLRIEMNNGSIITRKVLINK